LDDEVGRPAFPPISARSSGGIRGSGARARGSGGAHAFGDDETSYRYLPTIVEPSLVYEPPPPRRNRGDATLRKDLGMVFFVIVACAAGFVTWNAVGKAAGPVLAAIAERPSHTPSASASVVPSSSPSATPSLAPSPSDEPSDPAPVREPVDVKIAIDPKAVFASEATKTWCAASAVQMALNVNGPTIDTTKAFQTRVHNLEVKRTDQQDSHNGGAGPLGMVATLNELGSVTYELRIYDTRTAAVQGAASAIAATGHPVILLAWRGAHAWVATGFRANADPNFFDSFSVSGLYILDPWYPRVSSIWGPSDPPGTFQDSAEMKRNYLPWRRPDGRYPGRDGKFLAIVPVDAP